MKPRPEFPAGTNNRIDSDDEGHHRETRTIPPRWALCPLGWQAHAIDPGADHPFGLWIARCGHRLLGGITLHDTPPGHRCPSCTRWSQPGRWGPTGADQ